MRSIFRIEYHPLQVFEMIRSQLYVPGWVGHGADGANEASARLGHDTVKWIVLVVNLSIAAV